jgi:hypothetical protein
VTNEETADITTGATRPIEEIDVVDAVVATPETDVLAPTSDDTMVDPLIDSSSGGSSGWSPSARSTTSPSQASPVSSSPTGSANGSGDRLEQAASNVTDRASGTAHKGLSMGMSRAGESLGEVAQAVRKTGDKLRDQQPQLAGVADTAADQVDQLASRLRDSDPNELIGDVESFARRQPALFLGGAVLLGMAAARFLKASPPESSGSAYSGRSSGASDAGW